MDKQTVMSMMGNTIDQNLNFTVGENSQQYFVGEQFPTSGSSCWHYWQDWYYPTVIRESYPVYVQEKSIDKGQKAFEVIKMMNDKKLINLKTIKDFIEIMDCLIKIL
jgi:hypothetical protein